MMFFNQCDLNPWLRHGQQGVDEFGGKGFEFCGALGTGFKLVLLADEPVTVGLNGAGAEASGDQVGWFAVEGEGVQAHGSEQCAAITSSDADVALVHREGDDFETAMLQAVEGCE